MNYKRKGVGAEAWPDLHDDCEIQRGPPLVAGSYL
jgi:hypothetical protein